MRARNFVNWKNRHPTYSSRTDEEFQPGAHNRRDNFKTSKYSEGTQTDLTELPANSESAVIRNASPPSNAETLYALSTPSNVLIWGTVLKQPFKLLVDTGAAVTVISERFFHEVLRVKYALTQKQLLIVLKLRTGAQYP